MVREAFICLFQRHPESILAVHNYGNLAPESAMHGIVLRFAQNCWVRNVRTFMTGSHPIATEDAKNIQVIFMSIQVMRGLTNGLPRSRITTSMVPGTKVPEETAIFEVKPSKPSLSAL